MSHPFYSINYDYIPSQIESRKMLFIETKFPLTDINITDIIKLQGLNGYQFPNDGYFRVEDRIGTRIALVPAPLNIKRDTPSRELWATSMTEQVPIGSRHGDLSKTFTTPSPQISSKYFRKNQGDAKETWYPQDHSDGWGYSLLNYKSLISDNYGRGQPIGYITPVFDAYPIHRDLPSCPRPRYSFTDTL
jgi:hypothetical protein